MAETEVKFYLADLPALETRLQKLGARLVAPRVHELNLRFDTPKGELTRDFRVLRLRQDSRARLTYKGPGKFEQGVRIREEIEFEVGDFGRAQALLEALGYQVSVVYEKFRTSYHLGNTEVVLDETPLGHFAEIEGPDGKAIRQTAARLGLDWEARCNESYIMLFNRVRTRIHLDIRDMTFDNFEGVMVSPELIGLRQAG